MSKVMSVEVIATKILEIRGRKVMLDRDLAELYGVRTKRLNEQVRRNEKRFPGDFMFQLTDEEVGNLKSQNATSSWGGRRKLPAVFSQEGVAMLSGVLNSDRAIMVNIQIMRAFVKLRAIILTHRELTDKLSELEKRVGRHDAEIQAIFEAIRQLMAPPPEPPKRKIGFHAD